MTSYSAVSTTGIYCRPGCVARPHAEHVTAFLQPAAAEAAGYRACLRCRPYRTSPAVSWGGPELVCRAVQMIVDGALDEESEEQLGRRLGVSARHLRRLFEQHVGVTPDQLARSRRAHFARRLLDDTDLPVADVAFAAGFGSVRQFNRACVEVFRFSPRELRLRRRIKDRLVADGGLALRLPFAGRLDWPAMLRYLAARAVAGVELVETQAGGVYRRTVLVDGDPAVLEVSSGGPDHLLLVAHLPHWEGLIHLVSRVRRTFSLDFDLEAAADALAADPLVGPLVRARPGLRPVGAWDPFEAGVRAVVGQQVSVAAAGTLMARIVERHGGVVPGLEPMGLSRLFPTPEVLASADLEGLGLTGSRMAAVRAFAAAVAAGQVRLDRSVGLDQLVSSIVAVPGLGLWTAHYVAYRLGEPDALPASDLGLRKAVGLLTGGPIASAADVEARARAWRPWRSLAACHLWAPAPAPAPAPA